VLNGSQIIANAFEGLGGNLFINAEVFLADPTSNVVVSGSVGITGAVTSFTWSVAPLPRPFMSAAALLPVRCAARLSGGKYSSLVLGGRDGLPPDPSGLLPSPLAVDAQLVAEPAGIGIPRPPWFPARFAFLADEEKAWPRLRGDQRAGGCAP
jgi:hypothetical protein